MSVQIKNTPKNRNKNDLIKNSNYLKESINEDDSLGSEYYENDNNSYTRFENEEENEFTTNSSLLLEKIINILEKLSLKYKDQQKTLYNILKEIYNAIEFLINDFTSEPKKIESEGTNDNNLFLTEERNNHEKGFEKANYFKLDIKSKVIYMLKIDQLNRKIELLNEELNNLKSLLFVNNSNEKANKSKNDKCYKSIMKKLKDIKDINKYDEYKYLIYIENQKRKIMDLEGKLKTKNNESLPKDIKRSIRCFPNFVQYDFKEDINPKTIPLYTILQTEKSNEREKDKKKVKTKSCQKTKREEINDNSLSPKIKGKNKIQIKPLFFSINNNSERNIYKSKNITLDSNNNKLKTDENYIKNTKIHKNIINLKNLKDNFTLFSSRNTKTKIPKLENLDKSNNVIYKTVNSNEKFAKKNISKLLIKNNDLVREIKEFSPKNIINNKKEFFIAHPTLYIAGVSKGKEQAFIGLPKKLLKLNKGGNFKSTMMVFPSSLNETMVNLEKLRSNKLHVDIENKEN
jgi:hypothetical protein